MLRKGRALKLSSKELLHAVAVKKKAMSASGSDSDAYDDKRPNKTSAISCRAGPPMTTLRPNLCLTLSCSITN